MYERNILIVDDNKNISTLYIPQYNEIAEELRKNKEQLVNYELIFTAEQSIESAIAKLNEKSMIDVLIIDYRFNNSSDGKNGADLVKYVRDNINKHCRVIFYTMHEVESIPPTDMISLVNNQIYRFVDKGKMTNEGFVELIYEAAVSCDIVVTALERFWNDYKDILSESKYTFMNEEHSFEEVISHIRMDDEIGRSIIDKLFHKALIDSVEF